MKRTIYIVIGTIVVIVVVLAVWWLFTRSQLSQISSPGTTGTLPQTGTQSVGGGTSGGQQSNNGIAASSSAAGGGVNQAIVKSFGVLPVGPVFDYFVDAQNNIVVVGPDGTVSQVTNGHSSFLSSTPIENLISTGFSYDGKKILVNFGVQSSPQSSIFDIATKSWTPLPQGLISPKWSPSDYKIAYLTNGSTTALSTIDATNLKKAATLLLTLNVQDFVLSQWLAGTQFVLAGRPTAYVPSSVLLFNATQKTLTPIVSEQSGAGSVWMGAGTTSSTATLGLVSVQRGPSQGYSLRLTDAAGNLVQSLSFVTLPSKCLFGVGQSSSSSSSASSSSPYPVLYCGIPRDAAALSTAHLPDDYDQMALFTSDDIYRINAVTGATDALLTDPSQNLDVSRLRFFNNTLFFVNRYDQKLYAISLSQ